MNYGTFLRARRRARNMSQRALARRVGVDFSYISKIETGRLPPPSEATLRRIAQALGDDGNDHLTMAQKVPAGFLRTMSGYPVEATVLLRRLGEEPHGPEVYMRLLRTLDAEIAPGRSRKTPRGAARPKP